MRLGQLLLQRRQLDRDQIRDALRRQARTGRPLGEILLDMDIVAHADVVDALRHQTASGSTATLATVPPSVARRLPARLAAMHRCVLVADEPGWVCIAMADPFDELARSILERALDAVVIPLAADPEALRDAQCRVYPELFEPPSRSGTT